MVSIGFGRRGFLEQPVKAKAMRDAVAIRTIFLNMMESLVFVLCDYRYSLNFGKNLLVRV